MCCIDLTSKESKYSSYQSITSSWSQGVPFSFTVLRQEFFMSFENFTRHTASLISTRIHYDFSLSQTVYFENLKLKQKSGQFYCLTKVKKQWWKKSWLCFSSHCLNGDCKKECHRWSSRCTSVVGRNSHQTCWATWHGGCPILHPQSGNGGIFFPHTQILVPDLSLLCDLLYLPGWILVRHAPSLLHVSQRGYTKVDARSEYHWDQSRNGGQATTGWCENRLLDVSARREIQGYFKLRRGNILVLSGSLFLSSN